MKLKVAATVDDLVLKPNCSSTNILLLVKCWYILTYKTFPKTLENARGSIVRHIAFISTFEYSLITAHFSLSGNIPEESILLQM
jgi:hypothetical protein